VLKTTD